MERNNKSCQRAFSHDTTNNTYNKVNPTAAIKNSNDEFRLHIDKNDQYDCEDGIFINSRVSSLIDSEEILHLPKGSPLDIKKVLLIYDYVVLKPEFLDSRNENHSILNLFVKSFCDSIIRTLKSKSILTNQFSVEKLTHADISEANLVVSLGTGLCLNTTSVVEILLTFFNVDTTFVRTASIIKNPMLPIIVNIYCVMTYSCHRINIFKQGMNIDTATSLVRLNFIASNTFKCIIKHF